MVENRYRQVTMKRPEARLRETYLDIDQWLTQCRRSAKHKEPKYKSCESCGRAASKVSMVPDWVSGSSVVR